MSHIFGRLSSSLLPVHSWCDSHLQRLISVICTSGIVSSVVGVSRERVVLVLFQFDDDDDDGDDDVVCVKVLMLPLTCG